MISSSDILHGKILIVDDLEVNVLLLDRMLRGAGYVSIESTTDPSKVCELHRNNRYDLILLDLQMPGMDGFQVMECLKEIETGGYLPVIVVTAQPDHKLRAFKAGAKDFISKPFDLAEVLARVHNMLEVRLMHLEMKKLYDQVVAEQKVSNRLLLNVLPYAIAERLKGRPEITAEGFTEIIADSLPDVTVLVADIVEFTQFSAGITPEKLVSLLNEIFTGFDNIADQRGLEKIKTIGDAYMAVSGIPVPVSDYVARASQLDFDKEDAEILVVSAAGHVARAAHMALDMMDALHIFNERNGFNLRMRIGIDTGPAVAGVIGKRKFIYDLWGDTVNTASRMESHGVPGRIQVTESTKQRLSEPLVLEKRGVIDIKGKGEMHTWFLNGRNS